MQYAKAAGAESVAVVTTHAEKRDAANQLSADEVKVSTDGNQMRKFAKTFIIPCPLFPYRLTWHITLRCCADGARLLTWDY